MMNKFTKLVQKSSLWKGSFVILLLTILPILTNFQLSSRIIIFAIFALGYNLLLGYGGEMSFGHAAFFGLGAYGTTMALRQSLSLPTSMIVGIIISGIIGILFGIISLKRRGIYLSMITLALAQMVYTVVIQATDITGGSNGLSVPFEVSNLITIGSPGITLYLLEIVLLAMVWYFLYRIIQSPYGQVLVAIRENEERALALGYNTQVYLISAFTASALISGLAGTLLALSSAYVSPDLLFWSSSGEVVFITVIGGVGSFIGPLLGSTIFIFLSDFINALVDAWEFYFGLIVVLIVLFAPSGVYRLYRTITNMIDF